MNRPPDPADIGLTFALSHLEDSPLEFILITLDRDKIHSGEASISVDMRVADHDILNLMTQKLLEATAQLQQPIPRKKK